MGFEWQFGTQSTAGRPPANGKGGVEIVDSAFNSGLCDFRLDATRVLTLLLLSSNPGIGRVSSAWSGSVSDWPTIRTESSHLAVDRGVLTLLGEEESDFRVPTSLSMRERSDAEV